MASSLQESSENVSWQSADVVVYAFVFCIRYSARRGAVQALRPATSPRKTVMEAFGRVNTVSADALTDETTGGRFGSA
jgi:hypothetical protein